MVSIHYVDPNALIAEVAQELKSSDIVQPPEWAKFVKTGPAKERPPADSDWWYMRAASVLRTVHMRGPIGVSKLRTRYGSKQDRGLAPERFRMASGSILRTVLQQLEKEGYMIQSKDRSDKGRQITSKGQSLLENSAAKVLKKSDNSDSDKSDEKKTNTKKSETKKDQKKESSPKSSKSEKSEKSQKKSDESKAEDKSEKGEKSEKEEKKESDDAKKSEKKVEA